MSLNQKKWIVKDGEGRIYGPFTTDQVLAQIDKAYFVGDEQIASYPGGRWVSISKSPEFYDRLLDVLQDEAKGSANTGHQQSRVDPRSEVKSGVKSEIKTEAESEEDTQPAVPLGPPASSKSSDRNDRSRITKIQPFSVPPPMQTSSSRTNTGMPTMPSGPVIELTDLKELEQKEEEFETKSSSKIPLIFIGVALLLAAAALLMPLGEKSEATNRVHLLAPRRGQPEIPEPKLKEKFKKAVSSFQSDTFSGYQRAQNELVEGVEGAPTKPESAQLKAEWLSTLCLTYRELWPFAYQDSRDLKVLSSVMQEAKQLDPGGRHGATCEIVHLVLSGRQRDAQGLVDSLLGEDSQTPMLFEIRGDIYMMSQDYESAATYFGQAKTLWPGWQKSKVQEARALTALKKYPQAIQLYNDVYSIVPGHAVSKVEHGLLEAILFGQLDKGFELIKAGLEGRERLPSQIESAGLLGLAQIYDRQNQSSKALDYARRAFKVSSANLQAREMIVRLAGSTADVPKTDPRGLMFLGEQYVRSGDCFAAQAEFKAAFEAEPKNGLAAMKAGKCLWELNQSTEAIDWLRKAIAADPDLIAAYVELADYYAQRFDFTAAGQTLGKIRQKQPNSYEVYRGFATIELRRNNHKAALSYGEKALKLYETDLETFLILAKANMGLQSFQEAQRFAAKAIELDFNNTEARSLYGKIEASLHGVDQGATYMQQLINRYVISKGKQVPQAAIDYRITLGEIYMQDERFKPAEDSFRQAISLDANNKKALVLLGKALQAQNQPSESLEVFLRAAVLDPSDADPIFMSGQLYLDLGKLPEALRQFDRVMTINARYPRTRVQLGRIYLRQGDSKKALEEAMQERVNNPELADSYLLAAEAYFAMKQYSNCAAEYQSASRKVRSASILVRMARCYRLSGALDSAQSLLRQAQSLENGNPELYKEQGAIFHTKGMADEAVTAYDTYLKLVPNAADKAEIDNRIRRVQTGDLNVGE